MKSVTGFSLGRRMTLLVGVSMILMLAALSISGWLAVRDLERQISHERQTLARTTGRFLEYILRQNLEQLDGIHFAPGVNIEDSNLEPEKKALHSIYLSSIFDDGVFITNDRGDVLWTEPFSESFTGINIYDWSFIKQSLDSGKTSVSNIITLEHSGQKDIIIVTPVRRMDGGISGLVGGRINPTGRSLREVTQLSALGAGDYIDILDGNGIVLASSDSRRIFKTDQYLADQGEMELAEIAPISMASWTVAVRESEKEVMAPVHQMEQRFAIFGLSSLIIALFFTWSMARSFVRPIKQLSVAAQGISQGNLSHPIPELGGDEIGELGRSLNTMRIALKNSLEDIQDLNKVLEAKVQDRVKELEYSHKELERKEAARTELIRKMLSAQEEERKRIAREIHDETTQSLAALVMRVDAAIAMPEKDAEKIKDKLIDIKLLGVRIIDDVHKTIFDLRPSVLDDLGFLSALRWYIENRIGRLNIPVRLEVSGEERKLPPQVEIALFRVVQESIVNIVKHAEAQNVVLSVEFRDGAIGIEVEDDGKGFDVESIHLESDKSQGLGLLGMKERIMLLGGEFYIESKPGSGTRIVVLVPLD